MYHLSSPFMYKPFTHSSVFRHFMTYATLSPCVRLVSAQVFGQLISVSRHRLIKFKRRMVEKIHRVPLAHALLEHVLRPADTHLTNHGWKEDATIRPLASTHGSVGSWFPVKAIEHESGDPCRTIGCVAPDSADDVTARFANRPVFASSLPHSLDQWVDALVRLPLSL